METHQHKLIEVKTLERDLKDKQIKASRYNLTDRVSVCQSFTIRLRKIKIILNLLKKYRTTINWAFQLHPFIFNIYRNINISHASFRCVFKQVFAGLKILLHMKKICLFIFYLNKLLMITNNDILSFFFSEKYGLMKIILKCLNILLKMTCLDSINSI